MPTGGCPPGTRQYHKTALFGLIRDAKLCLSDYKAESLSQAQVQNAITNMNQNLNTNRIINYTSNTWEAICRPPATKAPTPRAQPDCADHQESW